MEPIVLVHGGFEDSADVRTAIMRLEGCKAAAQQGYVTLQNGGSVLDAVEAAVRYLENDELFNAGYGSVLNSDGEVEMDAMIMEGSTLNAGAVTVVKNIANPISLARLVMEKSPHVMFSGEGANRFAAEQGVPLLPPGSLVTDYAKEELALSLGTKNIQASEPDAPICGRTAPCPQKEAKRMQAEDVRSVGKESKKSQAEDATSVGKESKRSQDAESLICGRSAPCPKKNASSNPPNDSNASPKEDDQTSLICGRTAECPRKNEQVQVADTADTESLICGKTAPCPSKTAERMQDAGSVKPGRTSNAENEPTKDAESVKSGRASRDATSVKSGAKEDANAGRKTSGLPKIAERTQTTQDVALSKTESKEDAESLVCGKTAPCPAKNTENTQIPSGQTSNAEAQPTKDTASVKSARTSKAETEPTKEDSASLVCGKNTPCSSLNTQKTQTAQDAAVLASEEVCGVNMPCPDKDNRRMQAEEAEPDEQDEEQVCGITMPCPEKEKAKMNARMQADEDVPNETGDKKGVCGRTIPCQNKNKKVQTEPKKAACGRPNPCPFKEENKEQKDAIEPKPRKEPCGRPVPCPKREEREKLEKLEAQPTKESVACGRPVPCPKREEREKLEAQTKKESVTCGRPVPCPKKEEREKGERERAQSQPKMENVACGRPVPCPKKEEREKEERERAQSQPKMESIACGRPVPCPKREEREKSQPKIETAAQGEPKTESVACGAPVPCPKKDRNEATPSQQNVNQKQKSEVCGETVVCPTWFGNACSFKKLQTSSTTENANSSKPGAKSEGAICDIPTCPSRAEPPVKSEGIICGKIKPCPKHQKRDGLVQTPKKTNGAGENGDVCPKPQGTVCEIPTCPSKAEKPLEKSDGCGKTKPCPKHEGKKERKSSKADAKVDGIVCDIPTCPSKVQTTGKNGAGKQREKLDTGCGKTKPCPKHEGRKNSTEKKSTNGDDCPKPVGVVCDIPTCPSKADKPPEKSDAGDGCGKTKPCPKHEGRKNSARKPSKPDAKAEGVDCDLLTCPSKIQVAENVPTNGDDSPKPTGPKQKSEACGANCPTWLGKECSSKKLQTSSTTENANSSKPGAKSKGAVCDIPTCPSKAGEIPQPEKPDAGDGCGKTKPCPKHEGRKGSAQQPPKLDTKAEGLDCDLLTCPSKVEVPTKSDGDGCGKTKPCPKHKNNDTQPDKAEATNGVEAKAPSDEDACPSKCPKQEQPEETLEVADVLRKSVVGSCPKTKPCPKHEAKEEDSAKASKPVAKTELCDTPTCPNKTDAPRKSSRAESAQKAEGELTLPKSDVGSCPTVKPCPKHEGKAEQKSEKSNGGSYKAPADAEICPTNCPKDDAKPEEDPSDCLTKHKVGTGTVGAVAFDGAGNLASATSTGGLSGKKPGRSGDSCIVGAGGYADNNCGAVSITGHGETITKFCLAHAIINLMASGKSASDATSEAICNMTKRLKNVAGAITISSTGEIGIDFSSGRMVWAYRRGNELHFGCEHGQDDTEMVSN